MIGYFNFNSTLGIARSTLCVTRDRIRAQQQLLGRAADCAVTRLFVSLCIMLAS